ncbi:AbgT family transporter [Ornithinimicrobium sp. Y1694]|uniref:AbgT family transporter n=1 Tax=Ornithinimicrobium sp. Y1694 TaxID=3418590 RepID=UPI003CFA244C
MGRASAETEQEGQQGGQRKAPREGLTMRALGWIERVGNKLPNPFWLFILLAAATAVLSWILAQAGVTVTNPADGEEVPVKNLLSGEGILEMITEAIPNFMTFPPLGLVITVLLGVAVAEQAGLISACLRGAVTKVSPKLLTFVVALAGIVGSVAADALYVILPPLAALAFKAVGRSPIAGVVVAFAGVAGGFNASLLLTPTDALLAGLSTSAAEIVEPGYVVSPIANWYFSAASAVMLAFVITLVAETLLAKRMKLLDETPIDEEAAKSNALATDEQAERAEEATEEAEKDFEDLDAMQLEPQERRGIWVSLLATAAFLALFLTALAWPGSPLRGEDGGIVTSPVLLNIGIIIMLSFVVAGVAYGLVAGTITAFDDIPKFMTKGMLEMAPVLVLFFAASQFIAWFASSNIGTVLAVNGSELLDRSGMHPLAMLALVVAMTFLINTLITSGSAQWALMAPVIVPALLLVGISAETTQMAYRIGDSASNIISPLSPYFALILGYLQKYRRDAGVGTLISLTLPLSIAIVLSWFAFFVLWWVLGLPLGPGNPIR